MSDPDVVAAIEAAAAELQLPQEVRAALVTAVRSTVALTATEAHAEPASANAGPAPPGDPRVLKHLGTGGMGEVRRVEDATLGRTVAQKVPRLDHDAPALVREARLMARLQHPGVPPVYGLRQLSDGRWSFTMLEVTGRTLHDVLARLAASPRTTRGLITILERLAWTLAAVHEAGVVHADVKPTNVMVGSFGEVFLMDWGASGDTGSPVRAGTDAFRAPEQQGGAPLSPTMDVHAFGATLHAVLEAVREPDSGSEDPALAALATSCRAPDPTDRPPSMRHVASELTRWLDGAARAARARALLSRGGEAASALATQRAQLKSMRATRDAHAFALPTEARPEHKDALWTIEDEIAELQRAVHVAERSLEQTLRLAVETAPELGEAREALADHYLDRLSQTDGRASVEAESLVALVRSYGSPAQVRTAASGGWLSIATAPVPAQATLFRVVERRRRLELLDPRDLGPTPLHAVPLAPGSWVVELTAPGRVPVRYPVLLTRGHTWDGVPPDAEAPLPIWLPAADELGPGDRYVPAGWAHLGGDTQAADPLPAGRRWVDAFVIRAEPVTVGAYRSFLASLAPDDRATHTPPIGPGDPRGVFDDALQLRPVRRQQWHEEQPMAHLSWHDARAFAAWEAQRTGQPWRLPHEVEWEKAARGVDGRTLPWGEHFEPAWACIANHSADQPANQPVGHFPLDMGVYGVRGTCGHVRNWCANRYTRDGTPAGADDVDLRVLRGGSAFGASHMCRPAGRFASPPSNHPLSGGLRLARDLTRLKRRIFGAPPGAVVDQRRPRLDIEQKIEPLPFLETRQPIEQHLVGHPPGVPPRQALHRCDVPHRLRGAVRPNAGPPVPVGGSRGVQQPHREGGVGVTKDDRAASYPVVGGQPNGEPHRMLERILVWLVVPVTGVRRKSRRLLSDHPPRPNPGAPRIH